MYIYEQRYSERQKQFTNTPSTTSQHLGEEEKDIQRGKNNSQIHHQQLPNIWERKRNKIQKDF